MNKQVTCPSWGGVPFVVRNKILVVLYPLRFASLPLCFALPLWGKTEGQRNRRWTEGKALAPSFTPQRGGTALQNKGALRGNTPFGFAPEGQRKALWANCRGTTTVSFVQHSKRKYCLKISKLNRHNWIKKFLKELVPSTKLKVPFKKLMLWLS